MTLGEMAMIALSVGVAFLALCVFFRPLEMVFPARKRQKFFRPEWWQDLFFLLGQYLIFTALVVWVLNKWGGWLQNSIPAGFHEAVQSQPLWLQAVEVILLSDFCLMGTSLAASGSFPLALSCGAS